MFFLPVFPPSNYTNIYLLLTLYRYVLQDGRFEHGSKPQPKVLDVREGACRLRMLRLLRHHGRASLESQLVMCDGHVDGVENGSSSQVTLGIRV